MLTSQRPSAPALARIRRFLAGPVAVAIAAAAGLASTPDLRAQSIDGIYTVKRISASLQGESAPATIPKELLRQALSRNGKIEIKNNRMPVFRAKWEDVLNDFNFLEIDDLVKVSGPRNLLLEKSGDAFRGSSTEPVRVKFSGEIIGTELNINLRADFRAKVEGNTLTVVVPLRVITFGTVAAEGKVRLVAEKE